VHRIPGMLEPALSFSTLRSNEVTSGDAALVDCCVAPTNLWDTMPKWLIIERSSATRRAVPSIGPLLARSLGALLRKLRHCPTYRFLLACVLGCLAVAGQQAPRVNQRNGASKPKVRISGEVVNVYAVATVEIYVVVEDRNGRLLENLNQDDFIVTEDGAREQINYFSRDAEAPMTLGIVFDTSPSQESVLRIEQGEAKSLVRQVLRPRDSSFIVQFDRRVQLVQDLTGEQQLLARAIDGTTINQVSYSVPAATSPIIPQTTGGGSHLYDAITLATKLMMNEAGRKVLVLLTDGEDFGSEGTRQEALENAVKADVTIYAVAIADKSFYAERGMDFHGDSMLKRFSKATGGRMSRGTDAVSTAAAFGQIGKELRGQYLLRYTPAKRGDGSFRKIKVQVPQHHCTVRTRGSYYSQPE
jgi:VWFA-related protein